MNKNDDNISPFLQNSILYTSVILRRWRIITSIVFASLVITIVMLLLVHPRYTAKATLLPQTNDVGSSTMTILSGILPNIRNRQFGEQGVYAQYIYPALIKSRRILYPVVQKEYRINERNKMWRGTLKDYFKAQTTEKAYIALKNDLKGEIAYETGILTVEFTCKSPLLSKLVTNDIVRQLDKFNQDNRKQQSGNTLEHLNKRLKETYQDLENARKALNIFMSKHRSSSLAPSAALEMEELKARKDLAQEIYLTIYRERELTELEYRRQTPVVVVMDSAIVPTEKAYPKRRLVMAIVFGVSLFLAIIIAFFIEYYENKKKMIDMKYKESIKASINDIRSTISSLWCFGKTR